MYYINLHTHSALQKPDERIVLNVYPYEEIPDKKYYSMGIHPWKINKETIENDLQIIENQLKNPFCIAVGECGLDKAIELPLSLQTEVFSRQIILAKEHKKPLIIHCVRAYQEVLSLLSKEAENIPVVFHGFNGSKELAKQILSKNYYLSLGKRLFLNENLSEVVKLLPLSNIFCETDTLTIPIEEVYQKVAEIKELSLSSLKEQIYSNFNEAFFSHT